MSEPTITKLYGGKIEIKFYGDGVRHSYFVNGKRAKSVTGAYAILEKKGLLGWAVGLYSDYLEQFIGQPLTEEMIVTGENLHSETKKEAANIGTAAHDWIEKFIKGEKPEMPEHKNAVQAINSFLEWTEKSKRKFTASEKLVYSKKHEYVGTLDATAIAKGSKLPDVIDYKTSAGLYAPVAYQTAAYLKADEEESKQKYGGRWAIRLAKETEEEYQIKQEKKLKRYLRKNPTKDPYEIAPYVPFEAKFLSNETLERDFKAHLLCMQLSEIHYQVEREFFPSR